LRHQANWHTHTWKKKTSSTENWNQNGNKNRNRNQTHAAKAPQSPYVCEYLCVGICVFERQERPATPFLPSEPLATGNHVLVSNMQLKTIFFFWLLNVIACNQNGSMLRLRNFTFPSPTFPTTHRTACNTFDATGCRAARRRNAFTNSIAIQPSFEAVQALATSLYIIHTL